MSATSRCSEPLVALVVDDDADLRSLARCALEGIDLAVVEAENGAVALDQMLARPPAIVLADVMMPVMDGFRLCEAIRGNTALAEIPVLMMTGLNDLESIARAYEVGATDFMTKPIQWMVLQQRIRYMLRASAASAELDSSRRRLDRAQRIAGVGSWEWDIRADAVRCSDQLVRILGSGVTSRELPYATFLEHVHPEDRPYVQVSRRRVVETGASCEIHYRIPHETDNDRFVYEVCEATAFEDGTPATLAATVHDITEAKRFRDQIERMATHDALTGLINRSRFRKLADAALAQARGRGERLWLLHIDLDRLERVNDAFGQGVGDDVLRAVAAQLRESVRASDAIARLSIEPGGGVARLGGDEFCIMLLPGAADPDDVLAVARRVQPSYRSDLEDGQGEIRVTSSVGVACYPDDGDDIGTLLRHARLAVEKAKSEGCGGVARYRREFGVVREKATLESQLPRALEHGELELHYQPIFAIAEDRIATVEALVRWNHPEHGVIGPGQFVPLAEDSGFIRELGAWVLRQACADCRSWIDQGLTAPRVSVNVSGIQLRRDELASHVGGALAAASLDPSYLEIEITESSLVEAGGAVDRLLGQLRGQGIGIAIDDFGTGYSSLSYLSKVPADKLKIDRSFLVDIDQRPAQRNLIVGIIGLAHGLGLEVVAEGIECSEQLRLLAESGCDLVQGYLLGRPVSASAICAMLDNAGPEAQVRLLRAG